MAGFADQGLSTDDFKWVTNSTFFYYLFRFYDFSPAKTTYIPANNHENPTVSPV